MNGNVLIAAYFNSTLDFPSATGIRDIRVNGTGTRDILLAKLNATGTFIFAKAIGGTDNDFLQGMVVDARGNILITGNFVGTADFNPSDRTQNLVAQSGDIFFAKYNALGEYILARNIGSTNYESGNAIATDAAGNIYIAGEFSGTIDFDPDINTQNLSALGTKDAFIARYDSAGNYVFARNIGGSGHESINQLIIDSRKNIYMAGFFIGSTDLAPCASDSIDVASTAGSSSDAFFTKFAQIDIPLTTIAVLSNTNCSNEPIKLSVATQHNNPDIEWLWYSGSCNSTSIGSGNSITVKPVVGKTIFYVRGRSNCGLLGACASYIYTNDKPEPVIPFISINTVSQKEICRGTVVNFTTKIAGPGTAPVYKWFKNNRDINVSTATYRDSTFNNGDSVFCFLTSSNPCATPKSIRSNAIAFTVVNPGTPQVTLSSNDMPIASEGSPIVISAAVANAGSNNTLTYRWIKNSNRAGGLVTNSPSYKDSFKNGNTVSCEVSSTLSCLARVNRVMSIQYKK